MTQDMNNHPLKGASNLEKDGFIALNEATDQLEALAMDMRDAITTLERPEVSIVIRFPTGDAEVVPIAPQYFDVPIGEVVTAHEEDYRCSKVVGYLKRKFAIYDGRVPLSHVRDELGLSEYKLTNQQLNNWLFAIKPSAFSKTPKVGRSGKLEPKLTDAERREVFVEAEHVVELMISMELI